MKKIILWIFISSAQWLYRCLKKCVSEFTIAHRPSQCRPNIRRHSKSSLSRWCKLQLTETSKNLKKLLNLLVKCEAFQTLTWAMQTADLIIKLVDLLAKLCIATSSMTMSLYVSWKLVFWVRLIYFFLTFNSLVARCPQLVYVYVS